ncbi:hypothetical protein POM88_006655 [Heracleum sosnowskyi]|uniref:Ubiquitin-like protease family profile domain-containing protein n=1 Tax=Heracleum sosnowskyi TaxID=360622 RepID=A0AAD8J6F3_9APIA|nr:hypothetical protein POM88_006655 [Heracleum sosnowskyi]
MAKICQLSSPSQSLGERVELQCKECPEFFGKNWPKFPDLSANEWRECPELVSKDFPECPKLLGKDWPKYPEFSAEEWKIIDILGLNELDRACNKLHDIDDFLGELTIGGKTVDFVRSTRQNLEKSSISGVNIAINKPRREQKVGDLKKSPFMNRVIDIDKTKLTKTEEEVWNWINGDTANPMQQIFYWEDITCMKHQVQTLKMNERISTGVIDAYASILNEDEKYRSVDSPIVFSAAPSSRFRARLDSMLLKHGVKITKIDLIFFTIHDKSHYYVVCFNLKNPSIEILDNIKHGEDSTLAYDEYPESLKELFVKYMGIFSPVRSMQLIISPRKTTTHGPPDICCEDLMFDNELLQKQDAE